MRKTSQIHVGIGKYLTRSRFAIFFAADQKTHVKLFPIILYNRESKRWRIAMPQICVNFFQAKVELRICAQGFGRSENVHI